MLQKLVKFVKRLCLFGVVVALLGGGAATLAAHYLFQEPAPVTWSRYLMPEFLWQRQKYPSFRWAFDILERGLIDVAEWLEVRPLSEGARSFEELIESPSVVSKYVLTP